MTTKINNGGVPGSITLIKKGRGAASTLTHTIANDGIDIAPLGTAGQATVRRIFTSILIVVYARIKSATGSIYVDRGIGLDSIAMLILVAVFVAVRVVSWMN